MVFDGRTVWKRASAFAARVWASRSAAERLAASACRSLTAVSTARFRASPRMPPACPPHGVEVALAGCSIQGPVLESATFVSQCKDASRLLTLADRLQALLWVEQRRFISIMIGLRFG